MLDLGARGQGTVGCRAVARLPGLGGGWGVTFEAALSSHTELFLDFGALENGPSQWLGVARRLPGCPGGCPVGLGRLSGPEAVAGTVASSSDHFIWVSSGCPVAGWLAGHWQLISEVLCKRRLCVR